MKPRAADQNRARHISRITPHLPRDRLHPPLAIIAQLSTTSSRNNSSAIRLPPEDLSNDKSIDTTAMASDEKVLLPSYEGVTFQDQRPDGQRILDSLTTVRATHIQSTVNTHIYPLIEKRAERGLSQTVLALIPSNVMAVDEFAIKSGFSEGTYI